MTSWHTVDDIESKELIPGYHAKMIHSERMTTIYWHIDKNAPLPEHSHPHEQIAHIIEGTFELTIEGNTKILEPGMVAVIPSNAKHSGKAISDCRLLDVFAPVREDYK